MKVKVSGLLAGIAFGFVLSWARLTDPQTIHDMLLLREPDVFLLMGSAILVAGVATRLLRAGGMRTLVTHEPIEWKVVRPERRHVLGSVLFGLGWAIAGTCPGPVAAMLGQGRFGGIVVAVGILAGVTMQQMVVRAHSGQAKGVQTSGAACI